MLCAYTACLCIGCTALQCCLNCITPLCALGGQSCCTSAHLTCLSQQCVIVMVYSGPRMSEMLSLHAAGSRSFSTLQQCIDCHVLHGQRCSPCMRFVCPLVVVRSSSAWTSEVYSRPCVTNNAGVLCCLCAYWLYCLATVFSFSVLLCPCLAKVAVCTCGSYAHCMCCPAALYGSYSLLYTLFATDDVHAHSLHAYWLCCLAALGRLP